MAQANEAARLNALRQLNLLDTAPSDSFDRITRMASQLFGLPIAAVSLTDADRQWFKSRVGVKHQTIPRAQAPCAQVADFAVPLVISDMLRDPVYQSSPLAHQGVRFYAGAPLMTRQGYCLGAMCVLGMEARESSPSELTILGDLAAMVMDQIELQHALGRIDPISGLPNRVQFTEDLDDLNRDSVPGRQRYLVLVDLASPEQVASAIRVMGSDHLDRLILEAAQTITAAIGPGRRAYHAAATQLVFLAQPGVDEQSLLMELEAQVTAFRSSISSRIYVTAAIGVAPFVEDDFSPIDLLRMAHNAAQDARECEANVGLYSKTVDQRHRRRYTIINDFRDALAATDQLSLVYQPRVDIASGTCRSVEALLRWRHPDLADISPGEFVPMVERTPMVMSVTAWVIDAALRQWSEWREAGLDVQISVNVSAANLEEGDFLERLQRSLASHNVPASRLELEVTESAVLGDTGSALALLRRIAAIGVRIAIDDFGTGYSSLSYLQQLPANVVKIDQSFMVDLDEDARKQSLVKTMIALGHEFGFRMVAEGVESDGVLSLLAAAGCDEAQGYLFARPMMPAAFAAWRAAPGHVTV